MLLQGGPEPYAASLRRMREALPELETIVPGHGPMGDGHEAIDALIGYLELLHEEVTAAVRAARSLDETYATCTDPWADRLDPRLLSALAGYPGGGAEGANRFRRLCQDLHRLNVLATYRLYEGG